jgi:TetR/AcrR family transcriptional repressor of lmrAB and yxaGH operons
VRTATVLFQSQGFHGTGLTQILTESGAPKGSFYHHFPDGKEQLAEAAVANARQAVAFLVDDAFARSASFEDGVRALASDIADWFERSGFAAGCPVTSVLLETVPGSDALRTATNATLSDWTARVAEHARSDGYGDRAALALGDTMLIALEGAWVLARARQDRGAFENAASAVVALAASLR